MKVLSEYKSVLDKRGGYIFLVIFVFSISAFILSQFLPLPLKFSVEALVAEDSEKIQFFYGSRDSFTESNSVGFDVVEDESYLYGSIIHCQDIQDVRIDPGTKPGAFEVRSIQFSLWSVSRRIEGDEISKAVVATNDLDVISTEGSFSGLSTGEDPYFVVNGSFVSDINRFVVSTRLIFSVLSGVLCGLIALFLFWMIERKLINKRIILLANVGILVLTSSLIVSWFGLLRIFLVIIFIYILPGYVVLKLSGFFSTQENNYEKILVSIFVGFCLWFCVLNISSFFEIKLNWELLCFGYISFLIGFSFLYRERFKEIDYKKVLCFDPDTSDLVMFSLFNFLILGFMIPVKGLLVAPLHDPAAISIYAQKLVDAGFVMSKLPADYSFYPPASFHFVGLISLFSGVNSSTSTLLVTNLCNVLGGFLFAAFIKSVLKNKYTDYIAVWAFSFLSIFPGCLYSIAGKNAQVIAYCFLFTSLFIFYKSIWGSIVKKLLFALITVAAILVHYNNLLILLIFCSAIFIHELIRAKNIRWKNVIKEVLLWSVPFVLVAVVMCVKFMNLNSDEDASSRLMSSGELYNVLSPVEFLRWTISYYEIFPYRGTLTIQILGILGYIFAGISFIGSWLNSRRYNRSTIFILMTLLGYYLVLGIKWSIFTPYFKMNMFLFYLVPLTFVISCVLNINIVPEKKACSFFKFDRLKLPVKISLMSPLIVMGLVNVAFLFIGFVRVRRFSVVKHPDIQAFEWINKNVQHDAYFMPANIIGVSPEVQTFPLDSIMYMKAFTKNEDVFSFVYGERLESEDELRYLYLELAEDVTNEEVLRDFVDSGVTYVFDGSTKPWGLGHIDPSEFKKHPEIYEPVYSKDGVNIYRIKIRD